MSRVMSGVGMIVAEASGHRTTRLCLPFYLFPWPTNNYSLIPNFIKKLRFNKLLRGFNPFLL